MGTLWLWEPEPLRVLIFEGLSKGQVPIKVTASGGCEHREQLVLHTLEHALPLSANITETPASFGITVGRWR